MKLKIFILMLMISGIVLPNSHADNDFQYRYLSNLKLVDTEDTDLIFFSQVRLGNNAQDPGFYMFGPRIKHDLTDHLQLGLHYSYVQLKINNSELGRSLWKFQHRIELEANPHWNLTDWLKMRLNNRVEFRWFEDRGSHNMRLRPKLQFEIPIKKAGRLKAVYINSEFFYNVAEHSYNENWTVPLGLKFKVTDQVFMSTFYMIQNLKGDDSWSSNHILGTFFNFAF